MIKKINTSFFTHLSYAAYSLYVYMVTISDNNYIAKISIHDLIINLNIKRYQINKLIDELKEKQIITYIANKQIKINPYYVSNEPKTTFENPTNKNRYTTTNREFNIDKCVTFGEQLAKIR